MNYLEYEDEKIPYRIIKSLRKTVTIQVNQEGVVVRAPQNLSNRKIAELMKTRARWIVLKYQEMQKSIVYKEFDDYREGGKFLYRGKELHLMMHNGTEFGLKQNEGKVWVVGEKLHVALTDTSIGAVQNLLEQWYRYEAKARIEERVHYYCKIHDFQKSVNRIVIKDQKSRWGSCSSKCNLNFNYRLIMAPDEVLDYVVVHELCHLKQMNHSEQFWREVETVLPEYQVWRDWLKKNGKKLIL